jgi:hypothetical protein
MVGIGFIDDLISEVGMPLVKKGIKSLTGIDLESKELTTEDKQKIMDSQIEIMKIDFEKLKLDSESQIKNKELDYSQENKQEENITNRWNFDSNSDSRFAKLLRPVLTAYLIIIVTILAIIDGNVGSFTIKEVWVELFTILCLTAVNGYFVLRTYEKRTGTSVWKK